MNGLEFTYYIVGVVAALLGIVIAVRGLVRKWLRDQKTEAVAKAHLTEAVERNEKAAGKLSDVVSDLSTAVQENTTATKQLSKDFTEFRRDTSHTLQSYDERIRALENGSARRGTRA